jgi:hypothetical protein
MTCKYRKAAIECFRIFSRTVVSVAGVVGVVGVVGVATLLWENNRIHERSITMLITEASSLA